MFYDPSDIAPADIDNARPACPTCHLEFPISGVCGECS